MGGRVKRRRGLMEAAALVARGPADAVCALCGRPLGDRVEWHHLIPKSEGGRETVPIHPICHRTIHATLPNQALARDYSDLEALKAHEAIVRYLRWIAGKPPDFTAPIRRAR